MEKTFQLQFLEVLQWRTNLTQKESDNLYASNLGFEGEFEFLNAIKLFIPAHWIVLFSLSFNIFGKIQVDALIITDCKILHFEVKNFQAYYYIQDGQWFKSNHERLNYNPYSQCQRAHEGLLKLLETSNIRVPIESKIVLINENETVNFMDGPDSRVLRKWELKNFFDQIRYQEQKSPHRIDKERIKSEFLAKQVPEEFHAPDYLDGRDIQNGIVCLKCHSVQQKSAEKFHIHCPACDYYEAKNKAVARTICEYSVLYPHEGVSHKTLLDFINTPGCAKSLKRLLSTDFNGNKKKYSHLYRLPNKLLEYALPNRKFRYKDYDQKPEKRIKKQLKKKAN